MFVTAVCVLFLAFIRFHFVKIVPTTSHLVAHICKHNKQFLKHNKIFLEQTNTFPNTTRYYLNTTKVYRNTTRIIKTQHNIIKTQHNICKTQHNACLPNTTQNSPDYVMQDLLLYKAWTHIYSTADMLCALIANSCHFLCYPRIPSFWDGEKIVSFILFIFSSVCYLQK